MKENPTELETAFDELENDEKIEQITVTKKFRMERIKPEEKKRILKNELMRYKGKYRVISLRS